MIGHLLQLIRWKNLVLLGLIVFITNLILQQQLSTQLPISQQIWLVVTALSICGAGNLINDVFDQKIDIINKPHKFYAQHFGNYTLLIIYGIINLIGIIGTFILFLYCKNYWLFILNFLVIILLFIYSKYLKTSFLLGNVLVSLLAGYSYLFPMLVQGIKLSNVSSKNYVPIIFIFGFYIFFTVVITFIREIAKDGEDIAGDFIYGSNTVAIKIGLQRTLKLLKFIIILSALSISIFGFFLYLIGNKFLFLIFIIVIVYQLKQIYFVQSISSPIKYLNKINLQLKYIYISGILSMLTWL